MFSEHLPRIGLAKNEDVPMLPHSWQRLLRERDAASREPRLSFTILLNMAPVGTTANSLELGGAVTLSFFFFI